MAAMVSAVGLSACGHAAVSELVRMEVGQFLQNPLPYNGKPVCLSGRWRVDRQGVSLVSKNENLNTRELGVPVPILSVDKFRIDPGSPPEIEFCGVVALDPHCFGVGVPPDRYPVCLPTLVELHPL